MPYCSSILPGFLGWHCKQVELVSMMHPIVDGRLRVWVEDCSDITMTLCTYMPRLSTFQLSPAVALMR